MKESRRSEATQGCVAGEGAEIKAKCNQKKAVKPIETALLDNLVDICRTEDQKAIFLINNEGVLSPSARYEAPNGAIYVPPPRDSMPWALPRVEKVIEHYSSDEDAKLFNDIGEALRQNVELPDERLYSFLSAFVLHTHIIDLFNYSPVLTFQAVAARGKTRTSRILIWMGRRGIHLETIREADLIRKAARFQCFMFFDVVDVCTKAERLGSLDVLLGRFDKGVTIPRVTNPEVRGFGDTQHFGCYGATVIASNEPLNKYLESRSVSILMRQASRLFENDPREKDFLELRERGTAFRARWLNKALPEVPKPSKDRLGDILKPIAQIYSAVVPDEIEVFNSLVRMIEDDQASYRSTTPEGKLIAVLLQLEEKVSNGVIQTNEIVDACNRDMPDRYHVSPVGVGKKMAMLGFQTAKYKGNRGYIYDKDLLRHLAKQYDCLIEDEEGKADRTDGTDKMPVASSREDLNTRIAKLEEELGQVDPEGVTKTPAAGPRHSLF